MEIVAAIAGALVLGIVIGMLLRGQRQPPRDPKVKVSMAETIAQLTFDPHDEIIQLLQEGKKIHAIKVFRDRTGASLKEAKDVIDAVERQLKIS